MATSRGAHPGVLFFVRLIAAAFVLVVALAARGAYAQPLDLPTSTTNPTEPPREGVNLKLPYWALGQPRPFLAAIFDVGGIFLKSELHAGYGKPHYTWIGATLSSKMTLGGVTLSGGVKGQWKNVDVSLSARSFASTDQHLLERAPIYYESDPTIIDRPKSAYQALDADVAVTTEAPGGTLAIEARGLALFGVLDGYDVFEDNFRVVVRPPFVWQTKLTYLAWPTWRAFAVGGSVELIGSPGRDNLVFRTGPVITLSLTDHLQAVGAAAFALVYHDELGLSGSDFGQIALRYRWASGEPYPDFP